MKTFALLAVLLCANIFMFSQKSNIDKSKPNCVIAKNESSEIKLLDMQKNVLGRDLKLASIDPMTGYFRTGFCSTDNADRGLHVVAAVVTKEFLEFSKSQGNDLMTPYPSSGFPGLKPGNIWCLCVLRWKEAMEKGVAPPVILESTNIKALEFVSLENLKAHKTE